MKTLSAISQQLIELINNREFIKAYEMLFDEEAESIDSLQPKSSPIKGLSILIEREKQFLERSKIHSIETSEIIHSSSYFAFKLIMNFSIADQVHVLNELCVYRVSEGKIISQQFFAG